MAAFEAVARHLSFTQAARVLNVQQPAVSRQIAALEEDLGTRLFERRRPFLRLTEAGHRLAAATNIGFDTIEQAADAIRKKRRDTRLTVNVSIGFATLWLLTRLADFRVLNPDIEVRVVTQDVVYDYDFDECDVAVSFGDGKWPGVDARMIFPEELFPICSPGAIDPGALPLGPGELIKQRLLYLDDVGHLEDWQRLLHPHGIAVPPPHADATFNSYMVYLHAALNGAGVALGWGYFMDDHLATGALIRPSDLTLRTERGYFSVIEKRSDTRDEVLMFHEWLVGTGQNQKGL